MGKKSRRVRDGALTSSSKTQIVLWKDGDTTKGRYLLDFDLSKTIGDLKAELEISTRVPFARQSIKGPAARLRSLFQASRPFGAALPRLQRVRQGALLFRGVPARALGRAPEKVPCGAPRFVHVSLRLSQCYY